MKYTSATKGVLKPNKNGGITLPNVEKIKTKKKK